MFIATRQFKGVLVLMLLSAVLLSSCGAKRKVAHRGYPPSGHIGKGKGQVMTDASDGRSKVLTGSKMENYANLLGVSVRELKNNTLYNFIDEWMGSPHRLGGTQKSGIDCSGFVGVLYNRVYGRDLPRTSRDMGENVKRKYESGLREGDLVFFSFGGKTIDHVGVYLHNNKFVHVSTSKGVIISDIRDNWYYKYFVRGGTPKI